MNNILCPENESVSPKNKRMIIIKELLEGQKAASQLKVLLQNQKPFGGDGYLSAEKLVEHVLRSFTNTLSLVTSSEEPGGGDDDNDDDVDDVAHRNLLNSSQNVSPVADSGVERRSQDSGESRERSWQPATKRGCYKRRKNGESLTIISSNTSDDHHAWRKYGQKEILNSKFPRSYFRCSHKHDQGCQATKQVQRIQENPDLYQTTYIGSHTCKNTLKNHHLFIDSGTWESLFMNSHSHDDSKVLNKQDIHPPISSPTPTMKGQECPKEDTPSDLTENSNTILWSDLKDFELSEPPIMPLNMASDSVHFGNGFHFDESHLL